VGSVQRELKQLTRAGLLREKRRGNQVLYRANRESPLYPELQSLVVKTAGLADVLRRALAPLADHIQIAFIFGSFARGAQNKDSDVDLMVIGNLPSSEIYRALSEPQQRLNREINCNVYPPEEVSRKIAARHHFLTRVLEAPKVFLLGDEHELRRLAAARVDSPAPD
jgi:predicted nucleotidyltransferase